jgi:hypothetical protein
MRSRRSEESAEAFATAALLFHPAAAAALPEATSPKCSSTSRKPTRADPAGMEATAAEEVF